MIFPTTTRSIALLFVACCQSVPSLALAAKPGNMPLTGRVVKLTQGDLMCYVDLIDARGKQHNIGADFAICDRTKLLDFLRKSGIRD